MNIKKPKTLFNYNIKTIRCFHKMSCIEFGEKLKIDGKRLSEVERGRLHPTHEEIKAIAKLSGYSEYVVSNIKLELLIIVNPKSV